MKSASNRVNSVQSVSISKIFSSISIPLIYD